MRIKQAYHQRAHLCNRRPGPGRGWHPGARLIRPDCHCLLTSFRSLLPKVTTILTFHQSLLSPFSELYVNDVIRFMFFSVWPLSTQCEACDVIHAVTVAVVHLFSLLPSIPVCGQTQIHPFCYWWLYLSCFL